MNSPLLRRPPQPHHLAALLTTAGIFLLYLLTLGPTTWFWDTSEYIAVGHVLGIPHPAGNPLFVLIARVWELLLSPTGLSVAVRINLLSATLSAATAGIWFLVAHRIISSFAEQRAVRLIGATSAALLSATTFTVWSQSTVNEKVYTVSLFTIAMLSWLALRWRDQVERGDAARQSSAFPGVSRVDRLLLLMVFVLALSVGNHLMGVLAAPALIVFVFLVKRGPFLRWRMYAWALLLAAVGLSVQLYLPVRAELEPVINEASPTCDSLGDAAVSIATFGKRGCEALSSVLTREQYDKPRVAIRQAPIGAQLLNYLQYFDWQWGRSLGQREAFFSPARLPVTLLFLLLGGIGAWRHRRADRQGFAYFGVLFLTLTVGLVFYLNFKYGFRQSQVMGIDPFFAEVRERDYFFLISFSLWGMWAGIGLTSVWTGVLRAMGGVRAGWALSAPVMAAALLPLALNWSAASHAGDYFARDWAYNLLNSVEPYGVLVTNGDNDTFPLWYLQEVEGLRQDVTVVVTSYLDTPWYARQIRQLSTPCPEIASAREGKDICQRPFRSDRAAPLYAREPAVPPTRSALPLTDVEIEDTTNAGYIRLARPAAFDANGVQATFPEGTVLRPSDQFILRMVKDTATDRPLYFASTTDVHQRLQLEPYLARQGLAYKLLIGADTDRPGLQQMPRGEPYSAIYGAYVDVPRSRELLRDTFVYRIDRESERWVDDATRNIPWQYVYGMLALGRAEELQGDTASAERSYAAAEAWYQFAER